MGAIRGAAAGVFRQAGRGSRDKDDGVGGTEKSLTDDLWASLDSGQPLKKFVSLATLPALLSHANHPLCCYCPSQDEHDCC